MQESVRAFAGEPGDPSGVRKPSGPGIANLTLTGNSDKEGVDQLRPRVQRQSRRTPATTAASASWTSPRTTPQTVVDKACNGPQNDVSVHEMGGKTVPVPVDRHGADGGGLLERQFTDRQRRPRRLRGRPRLRRHQPGRSAVHRHDPDGVRLAYAHADPGRTQRAVIYVSSYPLGSGITPAGASGPGGVTTRRVTVPHKKISIIEASAPGGEFQSSVKDSPLLATTRRSAMASRRATTSRSSCPRKTGASARARATSQIWDVSDPCEPDDRATRRKHTHIRRSPSTAGRVRVHALGLCDVGRQVHRHDGRDGRRRDRASATAPSPARRTASTTSINGRGAR